MSPKTPPNPPRLCHIVRSPDFVGYGFNLHTIKNRTGQFIGKVDSGSPAQMALLKEGDRILEVNGVNIEIENHKQVVARIKQLPNQTNLLVIDDEGDQWYKDHNIVITAHLPEVIKRSSVTSNGTVTVQTDEDDENDMWYGTNNNFRASNHPEVPETTQMTRRPSIGSNDTALVEDDRPSQPPSNDALAIQEFLYRLAITREQQKQQDKQQHQHEQTQRSPSPTCPQSQQSQRLQLQQKQNQRQGASATLNTRLSS